jgi:hypothetical protein
MIAQIKSSAIFSILGIEITNLHHQRLRHRIHMFGRDSKQITNPVEYFYHKYNLRSKVNSRYKSMKFKLESCESPS